MIDPILPLSIGIAERKGVYAFLLGSGISREAGIHTGNEIFWDTIRIIYRDKEGKEADDKSLQEWFEASEFANHGYSEILQDLFPTIGERQQFLSKYFEGKEPRQSHRYIAEMVEKGLVKVILTTNFDRLIEQALDEREIPYCVIASGKDVNNATPLEHSRCWIVKLHGDYRQQNIKNTPEELAKLDSAMEKKFREIVDRYGLVVTGYSGSDEGIMSVLRKRFPRYTLYWLTQSGEANDDVKSIIQQQDGRFIEGRAASAFLAELLRRVEAYTLANGGTTVDDVIRLTKEIVRKNDYVQYVEELKRLRKSIRQTWPKLYEEAKPSVDTIGQKELDKIIKDTLSEFSTQADPILGIGLVVIEHRKSEWVDDLLESLQDFMDTYEDVEASPGLHWQELQPIPIAYAGFMWWVWSALAFEKEQWIILKKLREFRVYSYSIRMSVALKDKGSFASRALWIYFDSTSLQIQAEKEFIHDYFQSGERFIDSLVKVNFVFGLLTVKGNIKFYPWFRRYYSRGLNRVSDKLKNDIVFTTDIAKNLFEESYESFTSNFKARCQILNEFQSQHWILDEYALCDLFVQKSL